LISIRKINDLSKEISPKTVTLESVGEDSVGQRVDNFLIKRLKYVPKSHIYRLLRSGQVRVNSKRISAQYRLQFNDSVRIPPVKRFENSTSKRNDLSKSQIISFDNLFHDESLLVINKPAGMAVHGGSGVSLGVIEQLRGQHPDWKFLELVHRLDRETSGCLVLAKKRSALRELHEAYGHIQEIIVQNFRRKPGTAMADAEEPTARDLLWTVAVARILFGPDMSIQAPPNLAPEILGEIIQAGINDWGGISPVTPDHVNPEAPWPAIQRLAARSAEVGYSLRERLTIYPEFLKGNPDFVPQTVRDAAARLADAEGYAIPAEKLH
jgi:hypothetical protein